MKKTNMEKGMRKIDYKDIISFLEKMSDIKQSNDSSTGSCIITKTQKGFCLGCEFEIEPRHFLRIVIPNPIDSESNAYLEHRLNKVLNIVDSKYSRVKGLINAQKQNLPNQLDILFLNLILDYGSSEKFNQIVAFNIYEEILDKVISMTFGPYSSNEDDAVALKKVFREKFIERWVYLSELFVLEYYMDKNGNPTCELQNEMYQTLFFSEGIIDNNTDTITIFFSHFMNEIFKKRES